MHLRTRQLATCRVADAAVYLHEVRLVPNCKVVLHWANCQTVTCYSFSLHAFGDLVRQVICLLSAQLAILPTGYDVQTIAFASVANSCHAWGMGGHKVESGRFHAWPNSVWKFQQRESILAK